MYRQSFRINIKTQEGKELHRKSKLRSEFSNLEVEPKQASLEGKVRREFDSTKFVSPGEIDELSGGTSPAIVN
jgi:hypothetical protein